MEKLAVFLGIFCCLQIGVLAQENKPKAHVVVKGDKEVKVGDAFSLECYGSETQLSYYIKNRLLLGYKDVRGTVHKVSSSFYPSEEYKPLKESGELAITYKNVPDEGLYMFNISLQAAKHSDGGMYTCTLMDEYGGELSSKSFRVIVLNPVEKVMIEIKEVQGAKSTHEVIGGDKSHVVRPGRQYHVHCMASGSNPAPVMSLMYNQQKPYIAPKYMNSTEGGQLKFTGHFDIPMEFDPQYGSEQTLTCSAHVPNKNFGKSKVAGLSLVVSIDKPDIMCANATSMLNDKRVKLTCNISTPAGLEHIGCNKVFWELPEIQVKIPTLGDTSVRRKKTQNMDILEGSCLPKPEAQVLETTLLIYHVKDLHFETSYFVQYEDGGNIYRVPVLLYQKVSSAHLVFPSLLTCIMVALISKLTL